VVAGLLSSAHATWFLAQQKLESQRLQSALMALPPRFAVTVVPMLAQQLSLVWSEKPMLLVQDPHSFQQLLHTMTRRRVREFLFIAPASARRLTEIQGLDCRVAEAHRGRHLHYLDLEIQRCSFRASGRRVRLLDGGGSLTGGRRIGTIGGIPPSPPTRPPPARAPGPGGLEEATA
jgi:hypothetical protein